MFMKSNKPAAPHDRGRSSVSPKPVTDWSFCDYYVPEPALPVVAHSTGLFGRWRKRRT